MPSGGLCWCSQSLFGSHERYRAVCVMRSVGRGGSLAKHRS